MKVSLFDYELPPELVAQTPAERREASRLLVLDRSKGTLEHRRFSDVVEYFRPGDVLALNDTRVIPARVFGVRKTLGKVEALFLDEDSPGVWHALLKAKGHVANGEVVKLAGGEIEVEVAGKDAEGVYTLLVRRPPAAEMLSTLERVGMVPLPPYIKRAGRAEDARAARELAALDRERYQTVYAARPGAVAAPTAGLHFTGEILDALRARGVVIVTVTLHVGLGTFRPVKVEEVEEHVMHKEYYDVGPQAADALNAAARDGRRVVAVGTTTARVLESLPDGDVAPARGWTNIFIYPPYRWKRVGAMITNFHLPKSTLLMMVSAFAGRERILAAYQEAIRLRYRFFSYGDAMIIL